MPARGGGRTKSGGGGGGARPPPSREETISKAMAYVLRHGAEKEKLKLDESGYINCQDLVSIKIQYLSFFGLSMHFRNMYAARKSSILVLRRLSL